MRRGCKELHGFALHFAGQQLECPASHRLQMHTKDNTTTLCLTHEARHIVLKVILYWRSTQIGLFKFFEHQVGMGSLFLKVRKICLIFASLLIYFNQGSVSKFYCMIDQEYWKIILMCYKLLSLTKWFRIRQIYTLVEHMMFST